MEEEEGQEDVENGKERGGTCVPLTEVEIEVAVWEEQGVSGDAAVCPLDGGECS